MDRKEYIGLLSGQIRCKRALPFVTRELEMHIEEQKKDFLAEGMSECEAEELAVKEMGDPVEVGIMMDGIHRPKMNWPLIFLIGFISAAGFGAWYYLNNWLAGGEGRAAECVLNYTKRYLFYTAAGFLCMVGICYMDYTWFAAKAKRIMLAYCGVLTAIVCFLTPTPGMEDVLDEIVLNALWIMPFLFVPLYCGVLYSYRGEGAFDGHDALYTGMIGMHGTKTSNFGVSECDLLVALGARFSDRVVGNPGKFASNAKVLHIDIDAAEINKNIRTDASVVGDLKEILTVLNDKLPQLEHKEWVAHIQELKEKYPLNYDGNGLSCPYVIEELDRITKGRAIVTTDVGQHQMWAAQYYKYSSPRTFLSSGGLGTMGYGLGACIGAKMGKPEKICVNIAGDGCFRMNMNELATASRYNIPIIQIVINNHVLGMVRQWQTLFYGQRYSQTVLNDKVDFCKVAEGLGCEAIKVTAKEEVAPAIEKALALKAPVLIECVIPEDDKVFPMVPAGAPISEAFDETDMNKEK